VLALCRRHRLPQPEVNVWIGPDCVDFLWREQRLVVEAGGWTPLAPAPPSRPTAPRLKLAGYEVVRFTHRQVVEEPDRVAATLRGLLRRRSGAF
jgi:very-short-patch-repair endonuclease